MFGIGDRVITRHERFFVHNIYAKSFLAPPGSVGYVIGVFDGYVIVETKYGDWRIIVKEDEICLV